jgi:hypothetical protein
MKEQERPLEFGDYISVEQKRYVGGNEFYTHKVIRTLESNSYTDVPVDAHKPVNPVQSEVVEIVECICCGVDESKTIRFRVKDVKFSHNKFLSDRDKFAIEFKDWCDKLSFMDKVTVHPIAGSGGSNGPRELTNSELLETYLRKLFHSQKQTQG